MPSRCRMFVIEKAGNYDRTQYWNCSAEHGCGWSEDYPKQAFSSSELTREIGRMMENGHFCDLTIRELYVSGAAKTYSSQACDSQAGMPMSQKEYR